MPNRDQNQVAMDSIKTIHSLSILFFKRIFETPLADEFYLRKDNIMIGFKWRINDSHVEELHLELKDTLTNRGNHTVFNAPVCSITPYTGNIRKIHGGADYCLSLEKHFSLGSSKNISKGEIFRDISNNLFKVQRRICSLKSIKV